MEKKLVIDPITRVEGHGKVTIHLDEAGQVDKAYLHIVEFRGFERFIQGHPYWEAPVLVQRLCGICPVSHHLAAAKAIDQLVGIDPSDLSPTAEKLRRLLHYAQVFNRMPSISFTWPLPTCCSAWMPIRPAATSLGWPWPIGNWPGKGS